MATKNKDESMVEDSRYLKKKKKERGVCQVMKTSEYIARSFEYSRTFCVLDDLIKRLLGLNHPRDWRTILQSRFCLRVVQSTLSTMDDFPGWMRERSKTHSLVTTPAMEISRTWIIQLRDPNLNMWISMYEVKPSMLPNAGNGLFALRPFKEGDALGVFYGAVTDVKPGHISSEYAIEMCWPLGTRRKLLVDPGSGTSSSQRTFNHAYFGLHMANNPFFNNEDRKPKRRTRQSLAPNMIVNFDLVGRATADIAEGDEILFDYNTDGKY